MVDNSKQSFLNAVFQWSLKNKSEDAPASSNVQPMNEEDKKWLNEALENMTVNPVERLKLCLNKLKDEQVSTEQKREFAEELCHWTEELDLAKDFFTVGGLEILDPLLDHQDDLIRIQGCSLIGTLVQNNDHCQRIIVQSGLQQKLLKIVDESTNPELKTKAVTAISALIRGYTLGQLQLQKYQGVKILIRALTAPIPRLQNKLCFLIKTICSSSAQMKKIFFENDVLETLIRLSIDSSCPDYHQVLETILVVTQSKGDALISLAEREPTLIEQFESKLNQRRIEIQGSDDDQVELQDLDRIRKLLHPDGTPEISTPVVVPEKQLMAIA